MSASLHLLDSVKLLLKSVTLVLFGGIVVSSTNKEMCFVMSEVSENNV